MCVCNRLVGVYAEEIDDARFGRQENVWRAVGGGNFGRYIKELYN